MADLPRDQRRVLVVAPDDDMRVAIREALRHEGFEVTEAVSAAAAWTMLGVGVEPNIVLLDLHASIADCAEFRRRQMTSEYATLPVVLMTSAPVPTDVPEFVGCPALLKPFDLDPLIATLADACASDLRGSGVRDSRTSAPSSSDPPTTAARSARGR